MPVGGDACEECMESMVHVMHAAAAVQVYLHSRYTAHLRVEISFEGSFTRKLQKVIFIFIYVETWQATRKRLVVHDRRHAVVRRTVVFSWQIRREGFCVVCCRFMW